MTNNLKHSSFTKKLGRYALRFFTAIGMMVFISFIFAFVTLNRIGQVGNPEPSNHTVLTYTFENSLPEVSPPPSISSPLLSSPLLLQEFITALDAAADDPKVTGFIARIKPNTISIAQVQELRAAIKRFQASGKFTFVFAPAFGDFSNGMKDYYLGSAFDEVWLQPIGNVSITGLSGQLPFFKETLDKLGIHADMMARAEYKTAVEPMTRNTPSKENEEMTRRLLSDLNAQMVAGMADSRKLSNTEIATLIDNAPLTDQHSLDAGLVDHLGYVDEMVDRAREEAGGKDVAKFWEIDLYYNYMLGKEDEGLAAKLEERQKSFDETEETKDIPVSRVAVIYASGAIMAGDSNDVMLAPIGGGPVLSAEKISAAMSQARRDSRVGAIVLRIDSPGGSASASETIARTVERAQKDGKSVIISMSSAAASGGYWISAKADHIFAQPATLTGSIGVLGGKITIGGLLDKTGVNIAEYNFGDNAGLWSSTDRFNAGERAKVSALLDHTYEAFLSRVSEGRNIPIDKLRNELAGGRVWTGEQALEIGLVDEIGGLHQALHHAKSVVNADNPESVKIVEYPPKKSPLEEILDILTNGVAMDNPLKIILKTFQGYSASTSAYAYLPDVR